jgi:undecaprenyl diphosphate synthase
LTAEGRSSTTKLPRHVAIIMDGNGRWAENRGLPRALGHAEGVESVRVITKMARRLGVEALTLYSFSTENWGRPQDEVDALMGLLVRFLEAETPLMLDEQIRLRASGEIERLVPEAREALRRTEAATAHCDGMVLNLALSYGSRQELVRACRLLAEEVAAGRLKPEEIDEAAIDARLYTAGLPDPDLVIRTAGERRLSNFLLWQVAYAELYVADITWPEFREDAFATALASFGGRRRKYGLTSAQIGERT